MVMEQELLVLPKHNEQKNLVDWVTLKISFSSPIPPSRSWICSLSQLGLTCWELERLERID